MTMFNADCLDAIGIRTMLYGLDLFSGIGGITVALSPWVRPVAYCEIEPYAQSVLLSRMASGELPIAPVWDDIRSLRGAMLPDCDIIYGGFPCQDISSAGNGRGLAGERSGLVFEIFRLVDEVRPSFIFLENVEAIRTNGGERVVKELATLGYDCRWDVLSAHDVGAPHRRSRWFILATYAESSGYPGRESDHGTSAHGALSLVGEGSGRNIEPCRHRGWAVEPDVGRVADGVPARVDRLRALGNAVVPSQAREAFCRLMGLSLA